MKYIKLLIAAAIVGLATTQVSSAMESTQDFRVVKAYFQYPCGVPRDGIYSYYYQQCVINYLNSRRCVTPSYGCYRPYSGGYRGYYGRYR